MLILFSIGFLGLTDRPPVHGNATAQPVDLEIPDDVMAVLNNSCLPCHGPDGKFKAKMKWNFENMDEFDKAKLISKLSDIEEMVDEEKMPPSKFLRKNPEHKPTAEDRQLLKDWAGKTAESLVGSNN